MKKLVFVILGAALLLVSCKKEVAVQSVSIEPSTLSLYVGDRTELKAKVLPADAADPSVTWTSSLQSVATVSAQGTVTAVGEGTTVISATAGGRTGSCTVTVSKKIVDPESVTMDRESLDLVKGDIYPLKAEVGPAETTDKTVSWTSSDANVASVDQRGRVSAIGGGEAVITATAGKVSAQCKVTVSVPVEGITLSPTSLVLSEHESATLKATLTPADVTDLSISWSSSDEAVATVDANGKVTAVRNGQAEITAQAGACKAICAVTVVVPVQSVSIDPAEITLEEEQSVRLVAVVLPEDATDKSVSWSSSDPSVASIDAQGLLSALQVGTATITVTASGKTGTCAVTVKEKTIPVTSVTLNPTSLVMEKGGSASLAATVLPLDATDKTVTWTSSHPEIVTVDAEGKVYAVKGGKSVITATAGDCSATCEIKVSVPIVDFTLSDATYKLVKGESFALVPIVTPEDADVETIMWTTSDVTVASVDPYGNVQGNKVGTATISARASGVTRTCKVTVYVPVTSVSLDQTEVTIQEGRKFTLTATVGPADASDKTVVWSSSRPDVAQVSDKGVVSALKPGSAVITANAGGIQATCAVTVTEKNSNTEDFGDKEGEW